MNSDILDLDNLEFDGKPYHLVALIQCETKGDHAREDFQNVVGKIVFIKDIGIPYDQIIVYGTVNGTIVNQIRYAKFKTDEQVLQTNNGGTGLGETGGSQPIE